MKYRKKPVVIEAFEYEGDFMCTDGRYCIPGWAIEAHKSGVLYFGEAGELFVKTLEGDMRCDTGDYVIKGVNNELYPCKPDIFKKTYDKAEEEK